MRDWVLLLPPSESKATPPRSASTFDKARAARATNSFPQLDDLRDAVLEALDNALGRFSGLEEVFEVRGEALEEALNVNRGIRNGRTLPASVLYAGAMYQAIEYPTLSRGAKELLDKNALILSGLFGLLRPSDHIPPYRLKMGANLGGRVGKLVNFWRGPVSEILRKELRGRVVWDFLPDQHRRVWDGTGDIRGRHSIKFVKRIVHGGVAEWKTISHHSKSLKGALVRHLLMKNARHPGDLQDFHHPDGYKYDPSLSVDSDTEAQLVFAAR